MNQNEMLAILNRVQMENADLQARNAKLEAALRNVRGSLTIDAAWVFAEAGLFTEEEFTRRSQGEPLESRL